MRKTWLYICIAACFCILLATGLCEEPQKVTVCQLMDDPPALNHKLIEVEGFISSDFEDFTLFDPTCRSWPAIWLQYGGKSDSGTMYCCGTTPNSHHPEDLVVENVSIPLVENDAFKQFDREIRPPFRSGQRGSVVHARIVGRFFAGQKGYAGRLGYGHMGCCSLLTIQEIKSVSRQDRDDLDYGASADPPDGCYKYLTPIEPGTSVLHDQQQAELGDRAWAFDDPLRVASDALRGFAKVSGPGLLKLNVRQKTPGRIVYEWKSSREANRYIVEVNHPYLLSFYAHDPKRIAWVVTAAFELTCGG